jgi:hypothetical protein
MFEDIISKDEFENPGMVAEGEKSTEIFRYTNIEIRVDFGKKIISIDGDAWGYNNEVIKGFIDIDKKYGDDSPFKWIDGNAGSAKLEDDWIFDQSW